MEVSKRVYKFLGCYFKNEVTVKHSDMLNPYNFQKETIVVFNNTKVFSFEPYSLNYLVKIDVKFLNLVSDITGVEHNELNPIITNWALDLCFKQNDTNFKREIERFQKKDVNLETWKD